MTYACTDHDLQCRERAEETDRSTEILKLSVRFILLQKAIASQWRQKPQNHQTSFSVSKCIHDKFCSVVVLFVCVGFIFGSYRVRKIFSGYVKIFRSMSLQNEPILLTHSCIKHSIVMMQCIQLHMSCQCTRQCVTLGMGCECATERTLQASYETSCDACT